MAPLYFQSPDAKLRYKKLPIKSSGSNKGIMYKFLLILILILLPTTALSGEIQLPKTGQTKCFDATGNPIICKNTGQDGELQKGVEWPTPRFSNNDDQTITDNLTSLIWTKDANLIKTRDPAFDIDYSGSGDGAVSWQQALDYIKKINDEKYLGFNDWRLPNFYELLSIISLSQQDIIDWLQIQGFANFASGYCWYWSSSTSLNSTNRAAWGVEMSGGKTGQLPKVDGRYYVWAIRDNQSVPSNAVALPVTGQSNCYDALGNLISCIGTGQDGELQKGVAWPNPRFIDNEDQTITDRLTGLIWTKDANAPGPDTCPYSSNPSWRAKPLQGALDYIKCLNGNNYLGKNDWRLPNRNELITLVNIAWPHNPPQHNAYWLSQQGFFSIQTAYEYWSSSNSSNYDAFYVHLNSGQVGSMVKHVYNYVWPVRSIHSIERGDINDDGQINLTDAILVMQIIAGTLPQQIIYKEADVNNDGNLGLTEVIYTLQKATKLR